MLCLGVLLAGFGRTMSWLFCDAVSTSCWESIVGKYPKALWSQKVKVIAICFVSPILSYERICRERNVCKHTTSLIDARNDCPIHVNCKIHFEDRSTTYRIVSSSVALIINVHLGLLRIPLISSNTTIFVHVAFCIESVYLLDYNVHTMIHKTMKIPLVRYYTSHGSSLPHNDTYFRYNFFASNFFHTPRSTSFSSSFSSSTPSNDSTKESSITSREVSPPTLPSC